MTAVMGCPEKSPHQPHVWHGGHCVGVRWNEGVTADTPRGEPKALGILGWARAVNQAMTGRRQPTEGCLCGNDCGESPVYEDDATPENASHNIGITHPSHGCEACGTEHMDGHCPWCDDSAALDEGNPA